ncbi:hypothetical protein CO046_01820 [Candidatus Peregrinibacteria bacterium CG_4_9_14_0_2_um_filter_53_11]|nr:MAG: hypothetical protein CO046_01820 [Candidatus Peregrinibacteria bacterium CG_4_9_14_0_2_um_filter_53_11]
MQNDSPFPSPYPPDPIPRDERKQQEEDAREVARLIAENFVEAEPTAEPDAKMAEREGAEPATSMPSRDKAPVALGEPIEGVEEEDWSSELIPDEPEGAAPLKLMGFDDISERSMKKLFLAAALVFFVLLMGVTLLLSWINSAQDGPPMPPPILQENQQRIVAESGGVVQIEGLTLTIPPKALENDTIFTVTREPLAALTDNYIIQPEGLRFLKPVQIELPYRPAYLTSKETTIMVRYFLPGGREVELPYTIDRQRKVLKSSVMEL